MTNLTDLALGLLAEACASDEVIHAVTTMPGEWHDEPTGSLTFVQAGKARVVIHTDGPFADFECDERWVLLCGSPLGA